MALGTSPTSLPQSSRGWLLSKDSDRLGHLSHTFRGIAGRCRCPSGEWRSGMLWDFLSPVLPGWTSSGRGRGSRGGRTDVRRRSPWGLLRLPSTPVPLDGFPSGSRPRRYQARKVVEQRLATVINPLPVASVSAYGETVTATGLSYAASGSRRGLLRGGHSPPSFAAGASRPVASQPRDLFLRSIGRSGHVSRAREGLLLRGGQRSDRPELFPRPTGEPSG